MLRHWVIGSRSFERTYCLNFLPTLLTLEDEGIAFLKKKVSIKLPSGATSYRRRTLLRQYQNLQELVKGPCLHFIFLDRILIG